MPDTQSEFLEQLRLRGRKRIDLAGIRQAFFVASPEAQSNPNPSRTILDALNALSSAGHIELPAQASWERVGSPPLPRFVTLVREEQSVAVNYAKIPWVPELGFWVKLTNPQLEAAVAINAFLLRKPRNFRLVPIKERSLEIFGDEKKLDRLRTHDTLFGNRLPLATIGAFVAPLPLPYRVCSAFARPHLEAAQSTSRTAVGAVEGAGRIESEEGTLLSPAGLSVLVVENYNSYWSFGEWNERAKAYVAIVYGAGAQFRSSDDALAQVLKETGAASAEYLGDIDPAGIAIPLQFNATLGSADAMRVAPAVQFYEWLLANGVRRDMDPIGSSGEAPADVDQWLPKALIAEMRFMFSRGKWIPQEGLGIEALLEHF